MGKCVCAYQNPYARNFISDKDNLVPGAREKWVPGYDKDDCACIASMLVLLMMIVHLKFSYSTIHLSPHSSFTLQFLMCQQLPAQIGSVLLIFR